MTRLHTIFVGSLIALGAASFTSCQSNGYASSLALTGAETQRDLTQTVTDALEVQTNSHTEFSAAFDVLLQLQRAPADQFEELYKDLQHQVDLCALNVDRVDEHIARVEEDAGLLFAGWESDLEQFSSPNMRARSEARMGEARESLQHLLDQLRNARGSMDAILRTQRDYVLFFNHNLSANSIATLELENEQFQADMNQLDGLIERAREQADSFVLELRGTTPETDA